MKQINYKLAIGRTFPAHHPRKGEETGFKDKIIAALAGWPEDIENNAPRKLHTIRSNYELWAERFKKINAGEAVLTLFEWSGKPRMSKHCDLVTLTREDGIGLQEVRLLFRRSGRISVSMPHLSAPKASQLAQNDGLNEQDMIDWFRLKTGESTNVLALIHFTKFRY